MILSLVNSSDELASARLNLALARLYKQKAEQYLAYFQNDYPSDDPTKDTYLARLLTIAKICRRQAKEHLVRIEKAYGKAYLANNVSGKPVAADLAGNKFRSWAEYQVTFENEIDIWSWLNG